MENDIFTNNDMLRLQQHLKQHNSTITTAESCTGGLVSYMITKNSGSSSIFKGSIVTYSNEIKEQQLGVKKDTMIKFGVVSCEVIEEMLAGVLKKFNSTYAIAISGVAGPTGGTPNKPVGTVAIGVSSIFGDQKTKIYHFKGDRESIQNQAAKTALREIFEISLKNT